MCYELSGELQSRMDIDAIPCDDFYQFACGGYMNNTVLKENQNFSGLATESHWLSNKNITYIHTLGFIAFYMYYNM